MKKWFQTACFLLILFSGMMTVEAASAGIPNLSVAMSANDGKDAPYSVKCQVKTTGKGYFYLPAFFQLDQLYLYFDSHDSLRLDGREVHSGDAVSFSPNQRIQVAGKGFQPFTITVMQSSQIPAVFIDTESGTMEHVHQKKGAREAGDMYMADAEGTVVYQGGLKYIRSRGNSTFSMYPKKPYQIKLESAAPLCGMAKDSTFILLANYLDRSELRNRIGLDLARYSGAYAFTPKCQTIDLYLNHSYAGCYLLTEKCEIDKDRLNITDLESALEQMNENPLETYPFVGKEGYRVGATRAYDIPNEPDDITGGYLLLANNPAYYEQEASGFVTSRGQAFTIQQPKYASAREIEYISGVMQQIEDALYAKDGKDPATGKHFSELLDMKSFVNRYLQSEVLNDYDGQRPYFYKDSDAVDGKVYCAPVWDQDNTLGVSSGRSSASYISLDREQNRGYYWFTQAMKQPVFRQEMIRTYYAVYRPAYLILLGEEKDETGMLHSIDAYTEEIRASTNMDHLRWERRTWNKISAGNLNAGETPDECAAFMKQFIRKRMKAMDEAYPAPRD